MLNWLKTSLSARAGLAVTLIATLALCSAISAVVIANISQGDAAAMNTAGSLRMATYRLMWKLEKHAPAETLNQLSQDMHQRLHSQVLTSRLDNNLGNDAIQSAYDTVLQQWRQNMLPSLQNRDTAAFQANVESFVDQLEEFIQLLQKQAETRQAWQQGIQGAALLLTIIILLIGMYELHNSVLQPLRTLVNTTELFRAGHLDARVAYQSEDELGTVAERFNAMAEDIEQSHQLLEQRVAEKTHNLARSNTALELLLSSSRKMASEPANLSQLEELIESFQKSLPGLLLTLCLRGDDESKKPIALYGNTRRKICSSTECIDCDKYPGQNGMIIPISFQGKALGEVRAVYEDGHEADDTEKELLQALTDLIGTALSLETQRERDKRLLLMDERATIARELHDSLAQELSYMKFQVSRLQTLIQRGEDNEQVLKVSGELRDGLNSAYRHLRELLTTFRLQIRDGGLNKALEDTVREFAERGSIQISLHSEALAFPLSSNEQINILQIVRESLSNCVRHAHASHVQVRMHYSAGQVEVAIEDNGIGITTDGGFDTRKHHGLSIMQERARSLDGILRIQPVKPSGTLILLTFMPEFLLHTDTRG